MPTVLLYRIVKCKSVEFLFYITNLTLGHQRLYRNVCEEVKKVFPLCIICFLVPQQGMLMLMDSQQYTLPQLLQV